MVKEGLLLIMAQDVDEAYFIADVVEDLKGIHAIDIKDDGIGGDLVEVIYDMDKITQDDIMKHIKHVQEECDMYCDWTACDWME